MKLPPVPPHHIAMQRLEMDATALSWLAVHGNLILAQRHPHNTGPSRQLVTAMIYRIGKMLLESGLITREILEEAMREVDRCEHWFDRNGYCVNCGAEGPPETYGP